MSTPGDQVPDWTDEDWAAMRDHLELPPPRPGVWHWHA